ncbi:MAG TPA: CARDB domain-containing protein [Rhodothermales bacterium]|nr:CARDB domain-containing protein [Rhodothermales bacterium]
MRIATISFVMLILAAWTTQYAFAQTDLSMLSFDVVETSATGNGSTLTVNFEVQNTGTAASGAFTTTFYYSDNTGFNPSNTTSFPIVGSATVSSIAAGGTSGVLSATVTLTPYTQSGTRYIHHFVDSNNDEAESNENNNRSTQVTDPNADEDDVLITGLPNLQATITSLSSSSGTLGDVVTVNYRISNVGVTRVPSSFWTSFYFSTDAFFDTGDADLGRESAGSFNLLAGGSFTETFDVTIPSSFAAGSYFLLVHADRISNITGITESDETDNVAAAPFTLIAGPDLVMDTFSFTATPSGGTLGFGDAVDFSFTVRNQGGSLSAPFTIYFYYDDDNVLSGPYINGTTNQPVIATFDVSGGLAAGATQTSNAVTTLPGEALNGARFLHYYIDAGSSFQTSDGDVFEIDETNNTDAAPITITGLPDLTVDALCATPDGHSLRPHT